MDFLIRTNGSDESSKSDILDDKCIWLQGNQFFKEFGQFLQFTFKDKDVHREESPYPADTRIANHVAYIVERKIFSAAASVPMRNSEINGVGTVVDGRFEHFSRTHRQQKFWRTFP